MQIAPFPKACVVNERCKCEVPGDHCPRWQPVRFAVRCQRCWRDTISHGTHADACYHCGSKDVKPL